MHRRGLPRHRRRRLAGPFDRTHGRALHRETGGIGIDEEHPGFKHFFLDPKCSTKFTSYKATLNSRYGLISSARRVENDRVIYDAAVPPNTTATLILPASGGDLKATGTPVVRGEDGT
jgi:alpha-L-rhamnosidase